MKVYKSIMNAISWLEKFALCVIGLGSTLLVFINVLVRKFTTFQFAWTEELVVNFFILMIVCGCGLCIQEGSMISLSLIYDMLKGKAKKVLEVVITVFNCGFYAFVIKTGIDKVLALMANHKTTPTMMWPEWVFYLFIPVGFTLMALHNIEWLVDTFTSADEKAVEEEEA